MEKIINNKTMNIKMITERFELMFGSFTMVGALISANGTDVVGIAYKNNRNGNIKIFTTMRIVNKKNANGKIEVIAKW